MHNLKQLRERYKGNMGSYNFLAFLRWGGKQFYRINSTKGVMLNRLGGEFVVDVNNQIEEFDITDDGTEDSWGLTEDQYYPWPWFPGRTIIAFTCIAYCPGFMFGSDYKLEPEGFITGAGFYEDSYVALTKETCLRYPEFFKPVYA